MDVTTDTKDAIQVLNGLIETCKDGEKGFEQVASDVKDSSLKTLFTKYAAQRSSYAQQLQSAVLELGGKPEDSAHALSGLHRGWIGLKEKLTGDSDTALINEAEAGEDAAMKAYREAVAKPLPAAIQQLIQKQFAGVQEAHGVVRDLKHSRQS